MKKSLLMLFSFIASIILPVKTFAETTEISSTSDFNDAVVEVSDTISVSDTSSDIVLENNGTVKLLTDIKLNKTLKIDGNIKLNLNGHTITVLKTGARSLYAIDNYGTFTLEDSGSNGSIQARGILNNPGATMTINSGKIVAVDENGGAAIWNEGTLTINGGTLEVTHVGSPSDTYGAGCLNNQGTAIINNGTFTSVNRRTYAIISTGDITIKNATVTGAHGGLAVDAGTARVSGGSFTSTEYYGLYVSNDGTGTNPQEAAVEVTGGTFKGKTYSVWIGSDVNNPVNSTIVIKGGTFKNKLNVQSNVSAAGGITVMGGTFEEMTEGERTAESSFVPEGYTQTTLENGTFRVLKVRKVHVVHESTSGNNDRGYNVRISDETVTNLVEGDTYSTDALTAEELRSLGFLGYYYLDEVYGPANGTVPSGTNDLYVYYRYSNKYKVTYRNTDDSVITTENVYYNRAATLADGPLKTGYAFSGWYTDSNLSGSAVTSLNVTDNISLYAKYVANRHNLSFVEERTVVNSRTQTLDYNSEIGTYLYNPTKTGYTFVGWYKDSNLTERLDFTTMPDEDVTLYAKWRINQYTVNFNDTNLQPRTVDYLTVIDLETPTRTGYTFEGWYRYSIKPSNRINGTTLTVKDNTDLYANWTINRYTLTFETNGGETISPVTQDYNTSYNLENVIPVREGYRFDGWYDSNNYTNGINGVTFTDDITVYAKWLYKAKLTINYVDKNNNAIARQNVTENLEGGTYDVTPIDIDGYVFSQARTTDSLTGTFGTTDVVINVVYDKLYTLSFNTNGGSDITTVEDIVDETEIDLSNYTTAKDNYEFAGWYSDEALTTRVSSVVVNENKTVYAKWNPIVFNISYNLNGGNLAGTNPDTYTVEDEFTLINPTKVGHTFAGWKDNNGNVSMFVHISRGTNGDLSYEATWNVNQYTLTYGNTLKRNEKFDYGTVVTLEAYNRIGYTFEGWYDNPEFTGTPLTEITILEDTQIFAKMSVKYVTITIKYVDNLGREFDSDSITGQEGEPYSITVPEYDGYRYRRASADLSGELSEMTITLTYDKLGTVTFRFVDENTGEDIYPSVVKSGVVGNSVRLGIFDYPRVPTGYRMTSSIMTLISSVTVGDEPKEIIINYSDLYTLTFNVNGGEAIPSATYKYNTLVELPTPVRENYRFDGWYRGFNIFSRITSVRMTSDITVNAIWVRQGTVIVRHVDENGVEIAPSETIVGDVDSRYSTQKVDVEGYYYVSDSGNTTGRISRNQKVVTYTYSNKYTVKFENTELEDLVVTYNDEVELEELTKDEYVFAGWYSDAEFTNKLGDSIIVTEDTTVYAYFIKISDIEIDPYEEKDEEAAEEAKKVIEEALANEELPDGIDAETKENIIAAAANGDTILVELEVTKLDEEDIPEDVELINSVVGNKKYGYYDVSIILRASSDDSVLGKITELKKAILVTLPIPEDFPELEEGMIRKYFIVRIHNGEVTVLETTLNDDNTVSAYSDEFSTYAVYYEDEEEELPPDTAVNENVEIDNIVYFDDKKRYR